MNTNKLNQSEKTQRSFRNSTLQLTFTAFLLTEIFKPEQVHAINTQQLNNHPTLREALQNTLERQSINQETLAALTEAINYEFKDQAINPITEETVRQAFENIDVEKIQTVAEEAFNQADNEAITSELNSPINIEAEPVVDNAEVPSDSAASNAAQQENVSAGENSASQASNANGEVVDGETESGGNGGGIALALLAAGGLAAGIASGSSSDDGQTTTSSNTSDAPVNNKPPIITSPIPTDLPSSFALSSLNGENGFALNGAMSGYDTGFSVNFAGDINHDGFADIVIGAPHANPGNSGTYAGQAYLIFGNSAGFSSEFELSDLDGSNGFLLNGKGGLAPFGTQSGYDVTGLGDVNGDKIDDFMVSAPLATTPPNGAQPGQIYVIYGSTGAFSAALELSELDGTEGFIINGLPDAAFAGRSISQIGDLNKDGHQDLLIGSPLSSTNGEYSGQAFVVFGSSDFGSKFELTDINGQNGFAMNGAYAQQQAGNAVSLAGDFNGDGFDDIIIGSRSIDTNKDAGQTYIVYGKSEAFDSQIELSELSGSDGLTINGTSLGELAGIYVGGGHDINGDGFDDVIIATDTPVSHVIFGNNNMATTFDLSNIDGNNGFTIDASGIGSIGNRVDIIKDFNGDGFDDVLIGARDAESSAGKTYLIYGKETGFGKTLELSNFNGNDGVVFNGINSGDISGTSIAGGSDFNGDNTGDLLIGAFGADPNGSFSGQTYIVFGNNKSFLSIDEEQTDVITIEAVDPEGESLDYVIAGGDDESLFRIDSDGNLSFLAAPDFENPTDSNTDNAYEVEVSVIDPGGLEDTISLVISVDNIVD